jgi:hypothetical protein
LCDSLASTWANLRLRALATGDDENDNRHR